jgi:polysaccharide pyruvyl transferase WcaK-like protein
MNVLLVGPFGGANLGDDLIALTIATYLEQLNVKVSLTTFDLHLPLFQKYRSVPVSNLRKLKFGELFSLKKYDLIIIAGGQQIQEPRIPNPFWGHLANIWYYILVGKILRIPVAILCVGSDKKFSLWGKFILKNFCKLVKLFTVRDNDSLKYLSGIVKPLNIGVTGDMVFLRNANLLNSVLNKARSKGQKNCIEKDYICVIPSFDSKHRLTCDGQSKFYSKLSILAQQNDKKIVIIPTDVQRKGDLYGLSELKISLNHDRNIILIDHKINLDELLLYIDNADCVVSLRMHPAIISILLRKNLFIVNTCSKMRSFTKIFSIQESCEYNELSETQNIGRISEDIIELSKAKTASFVSEKLIEEISQKIEDSVQLALSYAENKEQA